LKLSLGEVESKENQQDFFILKLLVRQLNLWIIKRRKGGELLTKHGLREKYFIRLYSKMVVQEVRYSRLLAGITSKVIRCPPRSTTASVGSPAFASCRAYI